MVLTRRGDAEVAGFSFKDVWYRPLPAAGNRCGPQDPAHRRVGRGRGSEPAAG